MKKTRIIILIMAIILIAYGSLMLFGNNVDIGESSSHIKMPKGFNTLNTGQNCIIISNLTSNYTISVIPNETIEDLYQQYEIKHENDSVSVSTLNIDNIKLEGWDLIVNDSLIHTNYFYEKNGITYQIYPSGDYNLDTIIEIVKSTEK